MFTLNLKYHKCILISHPENMLSLITTNVEPYNDLNNNNDRYSLSSLNQLFNKMQINVYYIKLKNYYYFYLYYSKNLHFIKLKYTVIKLIIHYAYT